MSAPDLDVISHAIPWDPPRKPKTSSTTCNLLGDLHKVNKKRRLREVVVNEDDENNAFQANSAPPTKRACRRQTSNGMDPEGVLRPEVDRGHGRGAARLETLLPSKTVCPWQWTMDAVPSPEVVADGDVSWTDDMPALTADGWSTPDRAEEVAFTRQGVDPAKYFKVTDPAGTKYACSRCGVVYPGLHELDTHWLRNHGSAVANWTTLGKIFPAHTAFLRIKPILEAHKASLLSHHFIDWQRDVRTWSSENISRGSFDAAKCSKISVPCTWNCFCRPYTLFPEMLLNDLDWSLRESRAPFGPVNPLDLSQSCLPVEPSNHVLDLSTNVLVEPLDLTLCTSTGDVSTALDIIANEESVEGREDGVIIMTDSSETKDTRCIAVELDAVSDVSLTSEPCFGPSTTMGNLVLNKEHTEENPHLSGSKSTEAKDLSPGKSDSCKETVSLSAEDNPEEPKNDGASDIKGGLYACPVCPSAYKRKWLLEKHFRKFHRSLWGLHCSADPPSSSEMSVFIKESNVQRAAPLLPELDASSKNQSAEKLFECICGYASKWKGNLSKHKNRCTTSRIASASAETSKREVCRNSDVNSKKGAITAVAAISTLLEETLTLSTAMESPAPPGAKTTEFKCEWCTLTFPHLSSLYRHANRAHALQLYKQEMEEALDFIPSFPLQSGASIPSCQQTPTREGSRGSMSSSKLTCDQLRGMNETEGAAPQSHQQQQQTQQQTQLQQEQQQSNPSKIRRSLRCGDEHESRACPQQLSQGHDEGLTLAGTPPSLTSSASPRRRRRRGRGGGGSRRRCRRSNGNDVNQQRRKSTGPALTHVPKYKCASCDFGTDQRSTIFQHHCGHPEVSGWTTRPGETPKNNPLGEIADSSMTPSRETIAGETALLGEVTGNTTSFGEIVGMTTPPEEILDSKVTSNPGEIASVGKTTFSGDH